MTPEAITQLLTSLDINPDKIKDEKYAEIIRVLLIIIDEQSRERESLRSENQKLRDGINYCLKVNKPNLKFVALKKMKIFRQKQRDTKDGVYRTQSLNQNWIK